MRILLDENIDRRLKRAFPGGHEIVTVPEAGWAGKKNGELLKLAEKEFDAFFTTDKGIPHQQNVTNFDLTIILLRARSNNYEDLSPLIDEVSDTLNSIVPGTLETVPKQEPS